MEEFNDDEQWDTIDDFEETLLKLKDKLESIDYATDMYRALCNMQWGKVDRNTDGDILYHCSWRYAGGLIARIRDKGEDYLNFYCSGNEGDVSNEIRNDLKQLGWEPIPVSY